MSSIRVRGAYQDAFESFSEAAKSIYAADFAPVQPQPTSPISREIQQLRGLFGGAADAPLSESAVLEAIAKLSELTGERRSLGGPQNASITGVNSSQFDSATVTQFEADASLDVTGEVTQAASGAEIFIEGAENGTTTTGGTLIVTGGRGAQRIEFTAGESLGEVASRVQAQRFQTGVTAEVEGDNLKLSTIDTGSAATVKFELASTTGVTEVTGVNDAQLSAFRINSFSGESQQVTGEFVSAATSATLSIDGTSGRIGDGATIAVTGNTGSADVALVADELLSDAADRINAITGQTGVVATVDGDSLVLTSEATGAAATVSVGDVRPEYTTTVSGVNGAQLSSFNVDSINQGETITLDGSVNQQAAAAELTYTGAGGNVAGTATFDLTGADGTAQFSITEGESLADVADRVNALAGSTGVTAEASGDTLTFRTTAVGASKQVSINLVDAESEISFSGANASQVTDFTINSLTDNTTVAIDGTIDTAATEAELSFQGDFLGRAANSANITLSGSEGSAAISVGFLEDLSSIRDKVNAESVNTGVTATVDGTTLRLTSTGTGSSATVDVTVNSGTFNTSGNNAGADATATINGQSLTAVDNTFTLSDGGGDFTFTVAQGFTGTLDTITAVAQDDEFTTSGTNASGLDTEITVNGQTLTAADNQFTVNDASGTVSFTVDSGFTGVLDTLTVSSTAGEVNVTGGNGNGTANGTDATARINGEDVTSTDGTFRLATETLNVELEFAEGFTGPFDAVTISSTASGRFEATGGIASAPGSDAMGIFNGEEQTARGNRFEISGEGVTLELTVAEGFTGEIDSINVRSGQSFEPDSSGSAQLDTKTRQRLTALLDRLVKVAEGGDTSFSLETALSTLAAAEQSTIASAEQARVATTGGQPLPRAITQQEQAESTRAGIISSSFRALSEQNPDALRDAVSVREASRLRQISQLLGSL